MSARLGNLHNTRDPNVCEGCRAGKRKCTRNRPVCDLCTKRGRPCVWPAPAQTNDGTRSTTEESEATGFPAPSSVDTKRTDKKTAIFAGKVKQVKQEAEHHGEMINGANEHDIDGSMRMEDIQKSDTAAISVPKKRSQKPLEEDTLTERQTKKVRKGSPVVIIPVSSSKPDPEESEGLLTPSVTNTSFSLPPAPKHIHFNDIDFTNLAPDLREEWGDIKRKVFDNINFVDTDEVVWDTTGGTEKRLLELLEEIRGVRERRETVPEMSMGLERLADMVVQFHDFYERLRTCMMSMGALREELQKGHLAMSV